MEAKRAVPILTLLCACAVTTDSKPVELPGEGVRTLKIELLALDLESCSRCTGTEANLEQALRLVGGLFEQTETHVVVERHVVKTAEEAVRLRMNASPTVRVAGRDIDVELWESNCGDCGELCGEGVNCRVWRWRGRDYKEAPVPLLVDAILRAYAQGTSPPLGQGSFALPENLQAFFTAKASVSAPKPEEVQLNDCCDRSTCCESAQKASCCGESPADGACGCK